MATAFDTGGKAHVLAGQCDCEGHRHAVSIFQLCAEGCELEADVDWPGATDFVHLQIDNSIVMNGKLVWVRGRRAQMRFFGQIHPAAIAKLHERAVA